LKLLHDNDASLMKQLFGSKLTNEVKIILFTTERGCQFCKETEQLLKEVAMQSSKIRIEVLNIDRDKEIAKQFGVEAIPATVILCKNGARLYFFGMPSGYQLKCLVEDIVDASESSIDLSSQIRDEIRSIQNPVVIKVFVTPSCPYSPLVVRSAHRFAIVNQNIRAEMIDSLEFGLLTKEYSVIGVPTTIINGNVRFEGASSEENFARKVVEAAAMNAS
jgi:glutaredoxin-like protein